MDKKQIELLAPAGKWQALEEVAAAGADAVYLGGKRFNMRLLRPGFNFSDQELQDAVKYLHQLNKRLYITVNNIYYDEEIAGLADYLQFLEGIGVDALIIQDIAVLKLHQQLGLTVPLHASVQMGLGSAEALDFLAANGVSQAVLSKNLSLQEITQIHAASPMTIEFFAHGDLCIGHTGKCLISSLVAGRSGNRGICIKPCRWQYALDGLADGVTEPRYYLAHKDLCLQPYIKEMVEAGVRSFKIEGRMRDADYLALLVSIYRKALDCVIEGREDSQMLKEDAEKLYTHRVRDYSTASLFSRTGPESVGFSGEREPFFPTAPRRLDRLEPEDYIEPENQAATDGKPVEISVKAANFEILSSLLDTGVNRIIMGYEYIRQPQAGWNKASIEKALQYTEGKALGLVVETQRVVNAAEMEHMAELLDWIKDRPRLEVMVNDLGSLKLALEKGIPVSAGPGLNVSNSTAAEFYREQGLKRISASTELDNNTLTTMLRSGADIELMVHGPLFGLVTDYCPARAVTGAEEGKCQKECLAGKYALVDEYDQHYWLYSDARCRNYVYYPYDLCLFPYLPGLYAAGLRHLRIDGHFYNTDQVVTTSLLYRTAADSMVQGIWQEKSNYIRLLQLYPRGLTAAPYFRKSPAI
jgi:putative protease